MTQSDTTPSAPQPRQSVRQRFLRRLFGRQSNSEPSSPVLESRKDGNQKPDNEFSKPGLIRRMSRRVVPGLPRPQTFRRQQSEQRKHLAPVEPSVEEKRATSVDRRSHFSRRTGGRAASLAHTNPRASAPSFAGEAPVETASQYTQSLPADPLDRQSIQSCDDDCTEQASVWDEPTVQPAPDAGSVADGASMTMSQYDAKIHEELEKIWILNLSMHFRDRSQREKFFVTYRQREHLWRRVTISLDYRDAPPSSLEKDLGSTKFQRDKSAKIYEAIRDSLDEIQFYDTVTNLKLETTDGRLHVHVVEDGNEIIHYPTVSQIRHLGCPRIKERDIIFDSHMSGFVYKVSVRGDVLIKKEIPSPDTVDEFLYEVNALNSLRFSKNVIGFYGVVVDDQDEYVKGLLISYADRGALVDVIYDNCKEKSIHLPWSTREKWARQIIQGLADVHESGFVQGDFTLSNIVIDGADNAKIIDINRRGCPVGWEPPEATALIESNHRLSMYIGVKSDLYQLGMVLWGLATLEDEPEAQGRPLILGPEVNVPDWYRQMTEICLSDDPRLRMQASALLHMFPKPVNGNLGGPMPLDHETNMPLEDQALQDYHSNGYESPWNRAVGSTNGWPNSIGPYADIGPLPYNPFYQARGRSPPSPLPSNYEGRGSSRDVGYKSTWAANRDVVPSYSDADDEDVTQDEDFVTSRQPTPTPTAEHPQPSAPEEPHSSDQAGFRYQQSLKNLPAVEWLERQNVEAGVEAREPELVFRNGADAGENDKTTQKASRPKTPLMEIPTFTVTDHGVAREGTSQELSGSSIQTPLEVQDLELAGLTANDERESDRKDSAVDVRFDMKDTEGATRHTRTNLGETGLPVTNETAPDINIPEGKRQQEQDEAIWFKGIGDGCNVEFAPTSQDWHDRDMPKPNDEQDVGGSDPIIANNIMDDVELDPDYIVSESRVFAKTNAEEGNRDIRPTEKRADTATETNWARSNDMKAAENNFSGYSCPRHSSLPTALTWIGAGHMEAGDDVFHEKGILRDGFKQPGRPDTAPTTI